MDDSNILISKEIYVLNVEYYLTYGANYQRHNYHPFYSYFTKYKINFDDLIELIEKENILNVYEIDNFKYFNKEKEYFKQ